MKVINFEEWKNKAKIEPYHLRTNKNIHDLDDSEVRLLLEKMVNLLNFSMDQIHTSFTVHKDSLETLDILVKNQNIMKQEIKSLVRIAEGHTKIFQIKAKNSGIHKDK